MISTLDSIILASEKVENKDNFLKFAKNLLIERIKELGIDKFKDGINSINNVDDLKTLKSTFEEYFAEKDKELQRLKKEKDAELKKTNTEIYLNKQELKEKQRDALQILHSLFLDRFGTEFLT
ncbi:MAG: hypothetical protein LBQ24_04035 [Candidatus Peribacteria bacterium]|nr:hypothetical protein [Candidatus Peribacteria bacterium]